MSVYCELDWHSDCALSTRRAPPAYAMTLPIRVAILECDTPVAAVKESYGSYGDIFENLLQTSLGAARRLSAHSESASSITTNFTTWDVVTAREYPSPGDVDAVLLTGSSMSDARSTIRWRKNRLCG